MPKKGTTMDPADLQKNGSNSAATLLSTIERIESLEDEKAGVAEQISDEKKAIKDMGFDAKIVAAILKRRKMKPDEREEQDSLIHTYEEALQRAADARRIE